MGRRRCLFSSGKIQRSAPSVSGTHKRIFVQGLGGRRSGHIRRLSIIRLGQIHVVLQNEVYKFSLYLTGSTLRLLYNQSV
jgi:hypothetical protein